jgi:hypothetical protein
MNTLRDDYGSIFAWALLHYTRKPYHGKVTFIWASEEVTANLHQVWNEKNLIAERESHIITGSHYGLLTAGIEQLSECLGSSLQKAQSADADAALHRSR